MADEVKKKILIVEDEMPLARALDIKLSRSDFETQIVTNGQEALDALGTTKFNLIVLDIIMPIMDGFTLLETLQKGKKVAPILVLSNLSQSEDMEKAKKLGAFDFLVKSNASLQNIVDYIKNYLENGA